MSPAKRRTRSPQRRRTGPLPIRALYHVSHLAEAMGVSHRRLLRLLNIEGAKVYRDGRFILVPLAELEDKVPLLWESLRAADALRGTLDDD